MTQFPAALAMPAGWRVRREAGGRGRVAMDLVDRAGDEGELIVGHLVARLMDARITHLDRAERFNLLDVLEGRAEPASDRVATERMNRVIAANVGVHFARRSLAELQRMEANKRADHWRYRKLQLLGIDAGAALKRGALTNDELRMAAKRMSDSTQSLGGELGWKAEIVIPLRPGRGGYSGHRAHGRTSWRRRGRRKVSGLRVMALRSPALKFLDNDYYVN